MRMVIRSSNGINEVDVEALLRQKRILYLEDEITMEKARAFAKQMMYLTQVNSDAPVVLCINSPGGDIEAGMMIYDIIQTCSAPVVLCCLGQAYSMAAILLAAGQHGRYILPHSQVMIHEPRLMTNNVGGKYSSLQGMTNSLLKKKHEMEVILAKHTKKTPEEIAEATKVDHYFSAQEAVDFGLADKIVGFDQMMELEALA